MLSASSRGEIPPMSDKGEAVSVEIGGQTYLVKAGAEPGYVEELAARVDAQMVEIGRSGAAVDSVRIAVLAALNIADECCRLRRELDELRESAERMAQALAKAIGE